MFAIFQAEIRIIDAVKRAALQRLLLELITATATDERLDEKLASMTLPEDVNDCM